MAPCPTNALAVNFKDFSAIIYTDKDGLVSWLNFEGPESKSPEAQYTLHNAVSADKKGNIVAYEGQLALIMYHHESKAHEVHVGTSLYIYESRLLMLHSFACTISRRAQ